MTREEEIRQVAQKIYSEWLNDRDDNSSLMDFCLKLVQWADEHPKKDLPKEYEKNAKWNRVNYIFFKVIFYVYIFALGLAVGTAMWTYSKDGFAMAIIGTIASGLFTLYFKKKVK